MSLGSLNHDLMGMALSRVGENMKKNTQFKTQAGFSFLWENGDHYFKIRTLSLTPPNLTT